MTDACVPPSHILTGLLPSERLLFSSDLVCLGTFRLSPHESGFTGGTPCTGHTVVFPRRAAWIAHEGRAPFVADRTLIPLYNGGHDARDLTDLALASGFCSHSHFGAAFRREFNVTPSALRGVLAAARGAKAQSFRRE